MNPLSVITFPYFTHEQVKEINKEIRKTAKKLPGKKLKLKEDTNMKYSLLDLIKLAILYKRNKKLA